MKDLVCINFLNLIQVANQKEIIVFFMKYPSISVYFQLDIYVCVHMKCSVNYKNISKMF